MKRSYVIALAGISAALAYVSIILSFYVDVMSISFGALAGICIMLPLVVRSVTGAIFAYVSASILSGLTIGFGAMTFIMFFGPFTIVGYLVDFVLYDKMKLPKWAKMTIGYVIKGAVYSATITGLYFVMSAFGNMDFIIESKFVWVAVVLLIVIFFLFDILMHLVFINLRYLVNNKILKNRGVDNRAKTKEVKEETPKFDEDVFGLDEKPSEEPSDKVEELTEHTDKDASTSRFEHFLKSEESDDKDNKEDK